MPADEALAGASGVVDFHGSRLTVGLAFVPEATVGDWLLVHAGFAIAVLDDTEAREVWELVQQDEAFLADIAGGPPPDEP